ncbi:MAG TPA: hypothetical protein VKU41_05915, partial [Polyangiaceae bacterium]|nr:hypothetical protein [Polyangiaceae bacterium]
ASTSITGTVNVSSNGKGPTFVSWLGLVGALSNATPPQVTISSPRHDVDAIDQGATDWIDGTDPSDGTPELLHFTFDTPLDASSLAQCGHVIYSDFHVAENGATPADVFPSECSAGPMTPQEKILEYMIWDLQSCVGAPPTGCAPRSCAQQGIGCGPAGDGCGGLLQCGSCKAPLTCGGGGSFAQCGASDGGPCVPQTCGQQQVSCGPAGDGCGHLLDCGQCTPPLTCGGAGMPGKCGMAPE